MDTEIKEKLRSVGITLADHLKLLEICTLGQYGTLKNALAVIINKELIQLRAKQNQRISNLYSRTKSGNAEKLGNQGE